MIDADNRWDRYREKIYSSKGGWKVGEGVTSHGYSILDELVGKVSFFQTLVLNVTGRLPEQRFARWLEAIFICMSWPDPRIWCNQVGALGGGSRVSPLAGVCLGTLASESAIYGSGSGAACSRLMQLARTHVESGGSLAALFNKCLDDAGELRAPGFSRPLATGDERVSAMRACARDLQYEPGPYELLALEMGEYVNEQHGENLNLLGYMVAFILDQGYSTDEGVRMGAMCVNAGVHACYAEYRDRLPDSFLPLRCEDIDYIGMPEREVPRNNV